MSLLKTDIMFECFSPIVIFDY